MNRREVLWVLPVIVFCSVAWADAGDSSKSTELKGLVKPRMIEVKLSALKHTDHRIMMDDTGLLWGDPLKGEFEFDKAQETCAKVTEEDGYPAIPTRNSTWRNLDSDQRVTWRLPTAEEWAHIGRANQYYLNYEGTKKPGEKDIVGNGTWMELSKAGDSYWSSTPVNSDGGWFFNDEHGSMFARYRFVGCSVRCVARR